MYLPFLALFFCFSIASVKAQGKRILKIGGIFEKENDIDVRVFRFAVDWVNANNITKDVVFEPVVSYASQYSSYKNIESASKLISQGILATVGPMTSPDVKVTLGLFKRFKIPLLAPSATDTAFIYDNYRYKFLLRMLTHNAAQDIALVDLINQFKWERMGILTSRTDYGMNGLTDFKEYGVGQFKWVILATEHFAVPTDYTKINATKQLLRLREKGTRVVILNCMSKYVEYIMKQAERLDMLNEWVWILTDGAIAKEGSTKYKEGLIGVRYPQTGKGRLSGPVNKAWSARKEKTKIEGRTGRIFDAVLTIAYGVNLLRDNVTITDPPKGDSFCSSSNLTAQPWSLGEQFYNYLKEVKGDGFMHQIAYSPMGQPRARSFDIVNYQTEDGWVKVGYSIGLRVKLEKKRPVIWLNGGIEVPKLASLALKYKKLKVLIFESRPFVMAKTGNISTSDNKVLYEGFCIDLLEELKKKLSFDYELKLMKSFGEKQPDGSWDGILGDLTRGVSSYGHKHTGGHLDKNNYEQNVQVAEPYGRPRKRHKGA